MRRTKEDAAKTRAQILESAESLFIENGYDAVTLDEIATACELSRGAVHWHFKNKTGLLIAIREKARTDFVALADKVEQGSLEPSLDLLYEAVVGMFRDLQRSNQKRGLLRVMLQLDLNLPGEPKDSCFQADMRRSYERIIDAAVGTEICPPWTPSSAASALHAILLGMLQAWACAESDLDLEVHGAKVIKLFFGSLAREVVA